MRLWRRCVSGIGFLAATHEATHRYPKMPYKALPSRSIYCTEGYVNRRLCTYHLLNSTHSYTLKSTVLLRRVLNVEKKESYKIGIKIASIIKPTSLEKKRVIHTFHQYTITRISQVAGNQLKNTGQLCQSRIEQHLRHVHSRLERVGCQTFGIVRNFDAIIYTRVTLDRQRDYATGIRGL